MIRAAFRTSFTVMRDSRAALLLLLGCVYWPLDLLRSYVEYTYLDPDNLRASLQLSKFVDQFILIIPDAAVYYIGLSHLAGEKADFGESLCQGFLNYGRMWVTRVLMYLSFLSLLLLVVPGVYWLTRWSMSEANVVYEGTIGTTAFHRSWQMTHRRFWKVLGALAVGGGIYLVLCGVIIGLFSLLHSDVWWVDGLSSGLCSLLIPGWLLYICGVYSELAKAEELADATSGSVL